MNSFAFDFPQTGYIEVEKVLFKFHYPVLFTSRSKSGTLYLAVCFRADKDAQEWLLAETTPGTVVDLLSDKITLRDAFLVDKKGKYTICKGSDGTESIRVNDASDWCRDTSKSLPSHDEYIDAEDGEFDEEILQYRIEASNSSYSSRITKPLIIIPDTITDALELPGNTDLKPNRIVTMKNGISEVYNRNNNAKQTFINPIQAIPNIPHDSMLESKSKKINCLASENYELTVLAS